MVSIPAAIPVTEPEPEPIIATLMSVLPHVPPVLASAKTVEAPIHTLVLPVIDAGKGLMVKTVVVKQVVGKV